MDGSIPCVAVIFASQRTDADADGYDAASIAMEEQAAAQPGFLGIESARGTDGLGITVSYWRTDDDARAWKAVAEHSETQRKGRDRWYSSYDVRVATVTRSYSFDGSDDREGSA